MSASQSRAVASNDALHRVSDERSKLKEHIRRNELMTVGQLHGTPTYSGDPIAVTLKDCHLTTDGHSIGFR